MKISDFKMYPLKIKAIYFICLLMCILTLVGIFTLSLEDRYSITDVTPYIVLTVLAVLFSFGVYGLHIGCRFSLEYLLIMWLLQNWSLYPFLSEENMRLFLMEFIFMSVVIFSLYLSVKLDCESQAWIKSRNEINY